MPATIGTAYVQILPTTEGITDNLKGLLSPAADAAGESGGKSMGAGILKGLGAGAAAIGAAATAAIGGIVDLASQTAAAGDVIDKQSQKMGVSAEQYQAMAYAAEHSGFSVETFATAAKSLAATDFDGSVWDAVEAIQAIEDPAKRAAEAERLLGARAAQEMRPLINGTQTLEEYRTALGDLGGMMSNETVAASAAFEDAMTDMTTAIGGVKNGLVADFLPSMTDVINGVAMMASGSTEGISVIEEGFNSFIEGLMEKIPTIIETGGELVMTIGEAIMEHIPEILAIGGTLLINLATGISEKLPELIPKTVEIIMTVVDGLIQNMPALVEASLQLIVGLATGLVDAIPVLIPYIPQIVTSIAQAFIDAVPEIAKAGWQLIGGLAQGIVDGLSSALKIIKEIASTIVQKIKGYFGIASPSRVFRDEVGRQLMAGMAAGIIDNKKLVEEALGEVNGMTEGLSVGLTSVRAVKSTAGGVLENIRPAGPARAAGGSDADRIIAALRELRLHADVSLEGDARKVFRVVNKENRTRTRATNYNALAAGG